MHAAQYRLANGLLVNLRQDPGATQASALVHLSAGSLHEPEAWPGLAHLLEHVLFAGSERFQGEERLMAWTPARGGRLNATTQAASTAWFVEVAAPDLPDATARLVDMLQRPLLTTEAIRQEAAAIDAEYRMLAQHRETLSEAALSKAFAAPHPLHRFHVGSQTHFGQDLPALRQALRAYHQQFFHTARLTLWLQGPQSLAELRQLAATWGGEFQQATPQAGWSAADSTARLPPSAWPPALVLRPERQFRLQLPGAERLQFSFLIASPEPQTFSLLQELLGDTASHSLLATLRAHGLCDEIDLLEPYRSDAQAVISVVFHLCDRADVKSEAVASVPAAVEALFGHWLKLLSSLTAQQRHHYAALSRRRFARLSSLDRLRAQAFGLPPATEEMLAQSDAWPDLLRQLRPETMTRLHISADAVAESVTVQGFMLNLSAGRAPEKSLVPDTWAENAGLTFADSPLPVPPSLPAERVPLSHFPALCAPVLLLNPINGGLSAAQAALTDAVLQTISGACRHQGGELHFERRQGSWLLRLSGSQALMLAALNEMNNRLRAPAAADIALGERLARRAAQQQRGDIAVRALLAALPLAITHQRQAGSHADAFTPVSSGADRPAGTLLLNEPAPLSAISLSAVGWEATLYGGDKALYLALSRLLSRFPGQFPFHQPPGASQVPAELKAEAQEAARYLFPTKSPDAAVLLFCPLAEHDAVCLAAWQLIAAFAEPPFFQQLRMEKQTGYVVSCRFHQSAGAAGVLFALQSATFTAEQLFREIGEFIAGMADVICQITTEALQEKARTLRLVEGETLPENLDAVLSAWQKQQLTLPVLTQEMLNSLTSARLRRYYQQLAEAPWRWIRISNQ